MKKFFQNLLGISGLEERIQLLEAEVEDLIAYKNDNEELIEYMDHLRELDYLMAESLDAHRPDDLAMFFANTTEPIGSA
tara:strand:- start:141 stop:377 length:237 start_codon:yes stop_codon:yes gene_type:complete